MLPTVKTKRSSELVQLLLTFASFCAVIAASGPAAAAAERPGYHAAGQLAREAERDRRFSDLARFERKRREAEQQASRRSLTLSLAYSSICGSCRLSETLLLGAPAKHHTFQVLVGDCSWHVSCTPRLDPRFWSTA